MITIKPINKRISINEFEKNMKEAKELVKREVLYKLSEKIIPLARLNEHNQNISPLILNKEDDTNTHLGIILNSGDIFNESFIYEPIIKSEKIKVRTIADIETLHTCSFPLFFKPSKGEVLTQIPEELLDKIDAYELFLASDRPEDITTPDGHHHKAYARLYKIENE